MRIAVGDSVLDLEREVLLDASGGVVELRPQAFQVLRHLALEAGRLVSKDHLLAAVWPDVVVTDDSLVQAIGDVRRALGPRGRDVVRTIPRRGYLLVAHPLPAEPVAAGLPPPAAPVSRPIARARMALFAATGCAALVLAGLAGLQVGQGRFDGAGLRPGEPPSIAVLAFKDPQGDADAQLLARGVAEDLVTELARAQDLRVVSHQSSFRFDAAITPLTQIGQQLRSRYVVDGTVRRTGERLQLAVDLLDSADGRVVWSSTRRVESGEVGAAQQALVSRIAGTLQYKVRDTEERRALAQPPKSLDVYILTQHGKSMMVKYSPQGMREARRLLGQALAIDPNYAPAWVWLGMTNTIDTGLRLTGDWNESRMPEVLAQIERGIALDPELPIAYVALSQAQSMAGDFDGALASAERCMRLSPNDADCFYIVGKAQLDIGEPESAVRNLEHALDRNPMPPAYLSAFYATALWASRRYDDAIRAADDCLLRAPDFWRCRLDRLASWVESGRLPEAQKDAALLLAQRPDMTAAHLGDVFAQRASALRERRIAAAQVAGIPRGGAP